jgi:hypothetical protein
MTRKPAPDPRRERMESRLLALLMGTPLTSRQIAKALHTDLSNVHNYVNRLMKSPRRIRVCGFDPDPPRGCKPARMFALGSAPDAKLVSKREAAKNRAPRLDRQMGAVKQLLKTPCTSTEVANALNITESRARFYLGALRNAEPKRAFIKSWNPPPTTGTWTPVYALGNRPDALRPKRLTYLERKQKLMSNPERWDRELARRNKNYVLFLAKSKKCNPFSALFTRSHT